MPLTVQLNRPCPKCGNRALIWHVDMEKMIECQKCGTWFTVTHNYGEAEPPEERKGKVKE